MKKIFLLFFIFILSLPLLYAKNYKGAEYRTKESFLYGRFEASFKACGKEGTLSTMFTYFDGTADDPWASHKWNEIDIEILGRYNNDVQVNTITSGSTNHVRHQPVNFNPALDYHTYAFEWTPDYIAWFIDGVEVYRQTEEFVKTVTRAQKLMFNVWLPQWSNWMGVFSDQLLPALTYYDWTAYYAYTPGKGNYGSNNNFTFSWRDDFNSFDTNRWEKATHTWSGNNSDMLPDNINFKDGKMILSLTTASETGMIDKKGPTVITARAINENKIQMFFSEQVEKTSAELKEKYIIPGVAPVKNAMLLDDERTVELEVEKLDLNSLPNVIVMSGIKDKAVPPNLSNTVSRTLLATQQMKFPIKINVGGNRFNDFIADREFKTDTANYGYMEGSLNSIQDDIIGTTDDPVFQTGVTGLAKYIIRVPNGKYRVKLLFAELFVKNPNNKLFDVYIQGKQVINSLDIVKEAGPLTALEKIINDVVVNNYMIDIHFAALLNSASLNGIVIEKVGTSIDGQSSIPIEYRLEQNFPNPFNPSTTISYQILVVDALSARYASEARRAAEVHVTLKVYDILGREVSTLVDEFQQAGNYNSQFSIRQISGGQVLNYKLSSGVFFYRLTAGNFSDTKKMLLVK